MRRRARAFTLIELLAAMVIIGVLLSGVVAARSKWRVRGAEIENVARATRAADELLTQWFASDVPAVPMNSAGVIESSPGLRWRTTTRADRDSAAIGVTIVRLDVLARSAEQKESKEPMVSIEVCVRSQP